MGLLQGLEIQGDVMLSYRNLTEDDCAFIHKHWVGHSVIFGASMTIEALYDMIQSINTKIYNNNYYEMFGILNDNILVGAFSFYQRDCDIPEGAVYLGIEIDVMNRCKGFATSAVLMSFHIAREKGYKKIFSQARIDNAASINLHEKCGFKIIEKTFNRIGSEIYNYLYIL